MGTACPICAKSRGQLHEARDMMLGTDGSFHYFECEWCGCLSLVDVPANLSPYYPRTYYSLSTKHSGVLRTLRTRLYLSPLSFLVRWRRCGDLDLMRNAGITKATKILDVGCGAGNLIGSLRELGYTADGIDPFVQHDIRDQFGIRVQKKILSEVTKTYDLILFRHSLEHIENHKQVLQTAHQRLHRNGMCIVCMPVANWAWKYYGTCWSQLDAPRHFVIHTVKSFAMLAIDSGFRIERTEFDSNEFQFWASELYRRNVPLAKALVPGRLVRARWRRRAKSLNLCGEGDAAVFYLRPIGTTPPMCS
jgi:SAM-dependent methyltransferase